jgi:hypothetical protein
MAGDHEPEAKEYGGSRRRNPSGVGLGHNIISKGAQGANPRRVSAAMHDGSSSQWRNGTQERFVCCMSVWLGISNLNQLRSI